MYVFVHQANQTIEVLKLPQESITNLTQLTASQIGSPRFYYGDSVGLVGFLETKDFHIGRDCYFGVTCMNVEQLKNGKGENWDGDTAPKGTLKWRDAYKLARAWLEALEVDVNRMEKQKQFTPRTEHATPPRKDKKLMSGRYWVHWGEVIGGTCVADVHLNLATKLPVRICVQNGTFFKAALPQVPNALALNALPDGPVLEWMRGVKNPATEYTNFFELLKMPPGWREAHVPKLVTNAERVVSILEWKPPEEKFSETVTDLYVNPPAFGLGGRVASTRGEVIFDTKGKLKYFQQWPPGATNYYSWLSHASFVIGTNEAREIGEQKLKALGFDLPKLSKDFSEEVVQHPVRKYVKGVGRMLPSAEFQLAWMAQGYKPVVRVLIYGDSKRIGRIEVEDSSYVAEMGSEKESGAGPPDSEGQRK